MSKFLTRDQIRAQAKAHGYTYAEARTIIEVESAGTGFMAGGVHPKILFERHVFWERLGEIHWYTWRLRIMAKYPRICNPIAGGYGKFSEQPKKLAIASSYNRNVALESCSWGLPQVMGYHWKSLGFDSLQDFVNAMYDSEEAQLDILFRFLTVNDLRKYVKTKQWTSFARRYNGPKYKKNRYDEKLAAAYDKFKNFN